jgi:predicted outer membrane repeat protein
MFCLDNGTTNADIGDVDLASHPRVIGSAVDLGAYEYQQDFTQTVHYVHPPISFPFNANTNVMSPYTNWVTAATNIQDAIDVAAAGDFIVVSNGIYATGGRAAYGFVTNRVTVNKPITLISLSGAKYTAIQGSPTGVRCAYVADGASIIGFTLSNGAAMFNGDNLTNQNGGGVWCQSPLATLSNCVITTCSSANQGGGAYSGTLVACTISYSHANNSGGGVAFGTLLNCMVTTNFSTVGGGTFSSLLAGCTLLNNNSSQFGGGAAGGILTNCLLARNYSFSKGGGACSNSLTDCILNSNWLSGPLSSKLPISGGGAYSCTLTNCMLAGNAVTNGDGGGAAFGLLIGCALANNLATYGGGAYSNTLNGCYLVSNSASSYGGGAAFANLTNCPIIFNTAYYGGGTAFGTCYDCLLTNNYAVGGSGGAIYSNTTVNCTLDGYSFYTSYGSKLSRCIYNANTSSYQDILDNCQFNGFFNAANGNLIISGVLNNCTIILPFFQSSTYPPIQYCMATNSIIYGFYPANSPHLSASQSFFDHCCTSFSVSGSGNFTNAPLFIESYSALTNPPPFHLATNSPCINAGDSSLVVNLMDLDGFPRVVGGAVDIGATEFQDASVTNVINMEPFIAWLGQNGLPTDGSANYVDSDGDHMNNWQEWLAGTSPTNALSVLQLAPPVFINYPSRVVLTWQSTTNRNYYLQDCSDLKNGFVTIQNNIIGRAGTTSFTNYLMTNSSSYFYRVGVQ